ncbi:MAG: site-2 protease family protein [Pseudomonadota bacterium]
MTQDDITILRVRGPWGVPVDVQPSILFLIFLIVGVHAGSGAQAMLEGALVALILVGSILLHEFGHAWGALVQRVPVTRVVLHGAGGTCQHSAAAPRVSEFIVAMGPVVNLALWAVLSLMAELIWSSVPHGAVGADFVTRLNVAAWLWFAAEMNLMLFALNLIPVQPLDGGKLAFFGLLRFLPEGRALQVAGALGVAFALLWIPAMIVLFVTFGFVLLFFPSLAMHWSMVRGGRRLTRMQP